jgi:type IV secretion system protein VirB11
VGISATTAVRRVPDDPAHINNRPPGPATIPRIGRNEHDSRLERKLRRELGERVLALLADERVEDILLNPDSSLWIKRFGEGCVRFGDMEESAASSALSTIAAWRRTFLNEETPFLETELPIDGSRFEGIVSPVVRRPVFAIRLRPRSIYRLNDYESRGILTDRKDPLNGRQTAILDFRVAVGEMSHAEIIRAAVREKKNILIAGATGSGKTTLANGILSELGRLAPDDRVISIEDTSELQSSVANHVELKATGCVTMLDCLRACMRLNPTRIVVGEVRGAEAHTLLKAWNTGHPGGIATIHANDALSALIRLESLVAEATAAPQQTLIGEAVDLVVFMDSEPGIAARRKVREVLLVNGWADGRYLVERV